MVRNDDKQQNINISTAARSLQPIVTTAPPPRAAQVLLAALIRLMRQAEGSSSSSSEAAKAPKRSTGWVYMGMAVALLLSLAALLGLLLLMHRLVEDGLLLPPELSQHLVCRGSACCRQG